MNGVVATITITNPGFGYTTAPTVIIDPPSGLLPDQTNASLTISNVGTNDTGSYFAVVTNAWGSITSSVATLTVSIPPFLTQSPTNLIASFGSNVSFTLGVGGTLPMNFQWYWQPAAGRAAVAAPDVRNGFVVGTTVLQGGGYYLTVPTVRIVDSVGNGAAATAVVTAGAVTAVNILTPGSGYSAGAQIVIDPPQHCHSATAGQSDQRDAHPRSRPGVGRRRLLRHRGERRWQCDQQPGHIAGASSAALRATAAATP
ncbi:MAG: hypothetical protein RL514_1233 [Verrucomicrobiota bacterium]|jgi:hypothetical protein